LPNVNVPSLDGRTVRMRRGFVPRPIHALLSVGNAITAAPGSGAPDPGTETTPLSSVG
jgi:hypothetical protein